MKKKDIKRFAKLASFIANDNKSKYVAEEQSPQAPNITPPTPEQEAEKVFKFRNKLAKKKGKSLLYETN